MATLKDIAEQAGVSMMTVSRALNNPNQVGEELRNKIIKTANRLNYVPHHGARSMASNKTGVIKVVTGLKTTNYYFIMLFAGIADYLSKNDYALILENEHKINYKCDGVIVMSLHTAEAKKFLDSLNMPFVLFGKSEEAVDCVDINNDKGSYLATKHLIKLGHKKIGYLGIESQELFAAERLQGHFRALKKYGLDDCMVCVENCDNTKEAGKTAAMHLLKNHDITAVACASDLLAMSMLEVAKGINKKVPDDLSVVGFDGVLLNEITEPKLTTIAQPVYEIGAKLAEILINRINYPEASDKKLVIDPVLHMGKSTKGIQ